MSNQSKLNILMVHPASVIAYANKLVTALFDCDLDRRCASVE
jgi:hypothetical protein